MSKKKPILTAGAIVATAVAVLGALVIGPAKADNVTDPDAGQVDRPVYYHNNNPAVGEIAVHVFGQKIDTDNETDLDNDADKQRAVVRPAPHKLKPSPLLNRRGLQPFLAPHPSGRLDGGGDGEGRRDEAGGSGGGDEGHHEAGEQDQEDGQEDGQEDEPERSFVQPPKTGH